MTLSDRPGRKHPKTAVGFKKGMTVLLSTTIGKIIDYSGL
jgi:hypothetical protein